MRRRSIGLAMALALALALGSPARAAGPDLVVASAAAMQATLGAALPGWKAPVHVTYGTAGTVNGLATATAPLDIVILPPVRLKALAEAGRVAADSITPLGATEIGVALRDGSKPIATATVEDLTAALLAAPSIGIADGANGATTGVHLSKILQQSGIEAKLGSRLHRYPDGGQAMEALARGDVELAMGQISETKPVHGVFTTGKLPPAWQLRTVYAGAVTTRAADPAAARALLAWLASPALTPALEQAGMERP